MKNYISINEKTMKTSTHSFARRLVLTLLALSLTAPTWAQLSGNGTEQDPYLIQNEADWATFTYNNNIGIGTKCFYKLTADITLGTEEEPLTTIIGTDKKNFRGTFDGDFHTIHIYMDRTEKYAAPFGVTDGATIKNLKVDGTITTTNKFAGGIVAYANNGIDRTTSLINCISSIHIICDNIITVDSLKPYDCTHGGLVGQNERGTLSFENCIFDGWIRDFTDEKKANKCTGFVAWVNNFVNYTNCTMAGYIDVKPNDDQLPNSMANFHRLSRSAKAIFNGPSYYINDYTYESMPVQGIQALTEAPENTISKVYFDNESKYYVPQAVIADNDVTYYGWQLTQGNDYIVKITNTSYDNQMIIKGINDYEGSYTEDIDPTYQINVTTWDDETKTGWYAIASPVNGQRFENVNNLTAAPKHNIYRYDEEKRQWQEYRNEANLFDSFENGRGYIYRTEENGGILGFNGTTNSGDIDCKLSYTEKNDKLNGFNLIGNPYLHNIYKSVSIPNDDLSDGYCVLTVEGTWAFKTDDTAIPAGTAILVQSAALTKGNCTITMRDTDEAPASKDSNNEIWFTVRNLEYSDVAHVEFKEGNGFSKMPHYNEEAPMLYINDNGEKFASANMSDDIKVISLDFEAKKMGKYTLSFKANGDINYLHLIDRMTGNDIDMLIEEDYSFISSSNDNVDRFIVKFDRDDVHSVSTDDCFAWQNGSVIMVDGEGELQIFDVTGRMVSTRHVTGIETISKPSQGVYIFKLNGKTQKIVVK